MKRICTTTINILLFLFFTHTLLFSNQQSLQGNVTLQAGSITYTIQYNTGELEWATYIREMTNKYLQAVETYLSIPFPRKSGFVIDGKEEVFFI